MNKSRTHWLLNTPALYAAVGAAVAGVVGFLLPDRSVPQPLDGYRAFLPVLIGVGFLVALLLHDTIRQSPRRIAYVLVVCILGMSLIQATLIRPAGDKYYLVGWRLTSAGQTLCRNCLPEDILARFVPTFGVFGDLWGWSFWIPLMVYVLLYSGLVLGVVAVPAALRRMP